MRARFPCLLLAMTGMVAVSCSKPPPNVVLILVDTLRADRLGAYGNRRGLTPFLDELAARGLLFVNAYSTTSLTVPAVASLFTSRYVSQHRMVTAQSVLDDNETMLAEQMQRCGYATAAFIGNLLINPQRGYARGFGQFFHSDIVKLRATRLRDEVRTWLDRRPAIAATQPLFLYLHYFDPHAPYDPSASHRKQFQVVTKTPVDEKAVQDKTTTQRWSDISRDEAAVFASLYDGEVAGLDAELRLMFDDLRQRHVLDNAIVVITADHGEEFQEHGEIGHGRSLFNELIHIPLIILAAQCPAATIRADVSLVDIAPTLLDLAGQPVPTSFEGRSLADGLCHRRPADRLRAWGAPHTDDQHPIVFELEPSGTFVVPHHSAGIIAGSTKLLLGPHGPEFYELATDPLETASATNPRAAELRAMLESTRQQLRTRAASTAAQQPIDDQTKEKMRVLGYDPG